MSAPSSEAKAKAIVGNDASSPAQVIEKTKKDPRFVRGLELLKEKRYEESVIVFEDLLRTMVEVENQEDQLAIAPVYYEYGHSMLSLAEATANVFGGSVPKPDDQEGDAEEDARQSADDLEVAWEMLEVARIIFSRYADDLAVEKELARVYMRLGDLGMESDVFEQARSDYEKSLMLRQKIFKITKEPDTTLMADLYCCLAISCIYQGSSAATAVARDSSAAAAPDANDSTKLEQEGLKFYVLAGRVMSQNIYRVAKQCAPQVLEFVQKRIPVYEMPLGTNLESQTTTTEGKGKRKAFSSSNGAGLDFKGESMETLKEDFQACIQVKKSLTSPSKRQENTGSNNMTKEEADLLEYMEIYIELKEKVDGLKESIKENQATQASQPVTTIGFGGQPTEKQQPVTTIGFGQPSTTTSSSSTTTGPSATVNVIPVVKKRKITPTTTTTASTSSS